MSRRSQPLFFLLALGWMGLIFWFSSQSHVLTLPDSLLDLIFKKTAHATAYGILWGLWWLATGRRPWLALGITIAYAISDEYHQTWVPGRHGRWYDVGIDTLGALTAMAFTRAAGFWPLSTES